MKELLVAVAFVVIIFGWGWLNHKMDRDGFENDDYEKDINRWKGE